MSYTIDKLTLGTDEGFGRAVRTARSTDEWARVHRLSSNAFEDRYDEEKEAIKNGASASKEFLALEVIVTLTHEIISTRRGLQRFVADVEGQ